LLLKYARDADEGAFAEVVTGHLSGVSAAALRLLEGDAHDAQDVVQTVFADLAMGLKLSETEVMTQEILNQDSFSYNAPS